MIKLLKSKIIKFIFIGMALVVISGVFIYQKTFSSKNYFDDKQTVSFCSAVKKGDFKKADKILDNGFNINTQNKDGMTPFLWYIRHSGAGNNSKTHKVFEYFVKFGADPLIAYTNPKFLKDDYGIQQTVFHEVARYRDIYYLKTLLENEAVKNIDFELERDSSPTALLQAMSADRFEHFKLLLDYGADINKWHNSVQRTHLTISSGNLTWKYAYELLKRGADYNIREINSKKGELAIILSLEGLHYRPSVTLGYYGTDYRQKCVEFLREKGVEVNPWMPEDEKYVNENGEDVLYIMEKEGAKKDQWVKFTESSNYKGTTKDPDTQYYLE